jgi:tight adherence protein B
VSLAASGWLVSGIFAVALTTLMLWGRGRMAGTVRDHVVEVDRMLRYLQWPVRGAALARGQGAVVAASLGLAAVLGALWPLVGTAAALWIPRPVLAQRCAARTEAFEAQLDSWMLSLASGLRASPSLGDALEASRGLVGPPLGQELALVLREVELGVPLDLALFHMGERAGSPVVHAALTILRIARKTGGDVGATLETAAANLREMARLEGVVRTKTAEGKAQALVVSLVPVPLVAGLQLINPGFLWPLWMTPTGNLVLAGACVLWFVAVVWARRIVAVEV